MSSEPDRVRLPQQDGSHRRTGPVDRVAVAVATYNRPVGLRDLLESLSRLHRSSSTPELRVIVVDNDAAGAAEQTLDPFRDRLDISFAVEKTPGIAAARNCCLDLVGDHDDAVIFLDDDEVVPVSWLDDLVTAQRSYDADIVAGPVRTVFPPNAPSWIVRGGFIQRTVHPTGTSLGIPATNNTLVMRTVLRESGDPRFNEAYSITGGSDTEFFVRLLERGARFVWCAEAWVEEAQPAQRLTLRWVWNRSVRHGNVMARIALTTRRPGAVRASASGRIVAGLGLAVWHGLKHRRLDARSFTRVGRGVGMFGATRQNYVLEYRRAADQ